MIDRSEILAVAGDLSLTADVVEKDYVLGWLLAGIYAHEDLASAWTFKGGTCLKKCYFETYRFSEDLDFTVSDESQLDADFLRGAFTDIAAWLYNETGLEIPTDQFRFDVYRNHRDGLSCQGRIYYNGPLRRAGSLPRIKLDLTVDEVLVLPPVERPVAHTYSDLPEAGITARCYAYEEVFGEKVRALAERTRPRDLYDVINLFRNGEFRPAAAAIQDVLRRKCDFKGIPVPRFADFAGAPQELIADWQSMLGHQLPVLPPFDSFWVALSEFFAWLETGSAAPTPLTAPIAATEEIFRPAVGLLRRQGVAGSSFLETIRFAAANRLCVELDYLSERGERSTRSIEPYSLRRTNAGDILLFAVRADDAQSRSYRLDRIQSARVSNRPFIPRYVVELTSTELGAIPPISRSVSTAPRISRASRRKTGPTYVYQCSYCQKKFTRSKPGSKLSPHKMPGGWPCPGRTGYLIDTKY
jgi:predicted nucleotidyltransferase component of viral defense system